MWIQLWNFVKLLIPPSIAPAMFGGGLLGYVMYDCTHYYLHHGKPCKGVSQFEGMLGNCFWCECVIIIRMVTLNIFSWEERIWRIDLLGFCIYWCRDITWIIILEFKTKDSGSLLRWRCVWNTSSEIWREKIAVVGDWEERDVEKILSKIIYGFWRCWIFSSLPMKKEPGWQGNAYAVSF